jgi:uncharacterized protein YndB with AHSA1/START domain
MKRDVNALAPRAPLPYSHGMEQPPYNDPPPFAGEPSPPPDPPANPTLDAQDPDAPIVPDATPVPAASPMPDATPVPPPSPVPEASPVPDATPVPPPTPRHPQRPPDAARCQRSLRPPVLEVWRYLSRPDLLARWFGEVDLELAIGGEFSLHAWNGDVVKGHVLLADPPSVLAFTWKPQGANTESRVSIRLEGDGPGTRVTIRHEGLASEPERRQARRLWREILTALRTAVDDEGDAHEWGASLPISVRVPLSRSAADIWPLLATAQGLGKWIGHVDRFDGTPEGLFRFTSRAPGREIAEEGTIEQMTPESRVTLGWEWSGESWGARTRVEMTLDPDPSGSAMLLVHSGFDRITPAQSAVARRHYAAAWPRLVANLRRLVAPVHA